MRQRAGNNPKRRVADLASLDTDWLRSLSERVRYVGSGHHKRHPADYGFERTNPVPTKSLCDAVTPVVLSQAQSWLKEGIMRSMVSTQRAFAAELLCPFDTARDMLDGDYSDENLLDVADYFQVSDRTVRTQLVNNHLLERSELDDERFALAA